MAEHRFREKREIEVGYIPILCASPLILAHSQGIFEKNGLCVRLTPIAGWSGIKELVSYGKIDAAHMLSPMPLACNLGIDGKKSDIVLSAIQNVNGQALTLATRHSEIENILDAKGFTFGVPYRFSMHYYLLCHYLAQNGLNPLQDVSIIEVAPPNMPHYLEQGWVDGVFAPEPFNQIPVNQGTGFIHVLSKEIWEGHPCCCFGTTRTFAENNPHSYRALLRSVLEAERILEVKYRARFIKKYGKLPPVLANEGRLCQVFLNLFVNAAHAITEGDVDNNEISVTTRTEGDVVVVEVGDSGGGIPSDHLGQIFEPFFTTKSKGIGSVSDCPSVETSSNPMTVVSRWRASSVRGRGSPCVFPS